MVRIAKDKIVHKRRSEEDARKALATLARGDEEQENAVILQDCLDELLSLRARTEEMRMFVQEWQTKLSRRA